MNISVLINPFLLKIVLPLPYYLMKHVFLFGSGLFRLYVRITLHHFAEKIFQNISNNFFVLLTQSV